MAKYPANMPYQEETLKLLANAKPHRLSGLWNFVEILATDDVTDATEVSFNDGQTWTRLRKGIIVPIGLDDDSGRYGGTVGLAFRNNTAGDVNVSVAVGFGSIVDARLLVDGTQGVVPVAISGAPAAGGSLPVLITGAPVDTLDDTYAFASNSAVAAGLVSTTLVAAGTNVNGIRVKAGGYFAFDGSPGQCHLFGNGANTVHIGGGTTAVAAQTFFQLERDVILPAGIALVIATQGTWSYGFNYKVL